MKRTNIYLDDATLEEIRTIRDRFRLASNTAAIRLAVREYAAMLARQDAAERRRAEGSGREGRT
jgi:hypothetical protein